MKTRTKQHELAFLRYLDALEDGDAEAVMNYLEQAETDEILRQMMLDYHKEQNPKTEKVPPEQPIKTIVPFKLKREHTRRMIQVAGLSSVAALVLITVGMIGIILGMRQNNSTTAFSPTCTVRLANEDNTINLIGGDDIERPIRVGVNNPFTVYRNTGEASEGYQVIFEGLRAIMSYDDLLLEGDCSEHHVLTIFPEGKTGEACEIEMELVNFLKPSGSASYNQVYSNSLFTGHTQVAPVNLNNLVVFDSLVDGYYPIVLENLVGGIPEDAVHINGLCKNYPLLYIPPRFDDTAIDSEEIEFTLKIDSMRVQEQRFEYGTIFYLEPIDKIWIALNSYNQRNLWLAVDGSLAQSIFESSSSYYFPAGSVSFSDGGVFEGTRRILNGIMIFDPPSKQPQLSSEDTYIGFARSEVVSYMANYAAPDIPEEGFAEYLANGGSFIDFYSHYLESSTGEIYQFYEDPQTTNSPTFSSWRWKIAGNDEQNVSTTVIPTPAIVRDGATVELEFAYGGHLTSAFNNAAISTMRSAEMTWIKVKTEYGVTDISEISDIINQAHTNGFSILIQATGQPDMIGEAYIYAYANWVGLIAAMGADAIEVWKEPNLAREWSQDHISGASYTQLLMAASSAIRANNPNTVIISAGLAPMGAESAFPDQVVNDDNFLRQMVDAGALDYIDCVGIHYNEGIVSPYQTTGDARSDNHYSRYFKTMVETYSSILSDSRPLCFTALGYLSPEGYPPLPSFFSWASDTTAQEQAQWLTDAISLAQEDANIALVIIWNVDFTEYTDDPQGGYAIIRPDGTCPTCELLGG